MRGMDFDQRVEQFLEQHLSGGPGATDHTALSSPDSTSSAHASHHAGAAAQLASGLIVPVHDVPEGRYLTAQDLLQAAEMTLDWCGQASVTPPNISALASAVAWVRLKATAGRPPMARDAVKWTLYVLGHGEGDREIWLLEQVYPEARALLQQAAQVLAHAYARDVQSSSALFDAAFC